MLLGQPSFLVDCCSICFTSLTLLLVVVDPILFRAHTLLDRLIFHPTILMILNQEGRNKMLTSGGYSSLSGQLLIWKSNIQSIGSFVPRKSQDFCFLTFNIQLSFCMCLGFLWVLSSSNSGTFEWHLWRINCATPKILIISCFNLLTAVVLIPPDIKSSAYKLFLISAISFILSPFLDSRCASNVPRKVSGDWTSPSNALVNHSVSICFGSFSFIQWNRNASLSSSLMRTCRKACFMSPQSDTEKNLFLTSTLQNRFCNAGPVSKHLFNEGLGKFDLAEASYTILTFVLSAFSLITCLCGI